MVTSAIITLVMTSLTARCSLAMSIPQLRPDITPNVKTTALSVNTNIMTDVSFLFGWQMAGAALSENQTSAACADISSVGHGQWAAIGLDPNAIKVPMCDVSTSTPDPKDSIIFIIHYSTEIFVTQLLGAFNNTASFAYLCNNIQYDLLDSLMLNDTAILGPLCDNGQVPVPPRPEAGQGPNGDPDAALSVTQTGSVLYAYILATSATTSSELSTLCAQAPGYVDNLDNELLNGTAFQTTLCGIKDPLSAEEALDAIVVLMTRMFITMLESVNDMDGWLNWLCNHVDAEGMNTVGLFGGAVAQTICQDSLAIKSS